MAVAQCMNGSVPLQLSPPRLQLDDLSNGRDLRTDPVETLANNVLDLGCRGTFEFEEGQRRRDGDHYDHPHDSLSSNRNFERRFFDAWLGASKKLSAYPYCQYKG